MPVTDRTVMDVSAMGVPAMMRLSIRIAVTGASIHRAAALRDPLIDGKSAGIVADDLIHSIHRYSAGQEVHDAALIDIGPTRIRRRRDAKHADHCNEVEEGFHNNVGVLLPMI